MARTVVNNGNHSPMSLPASEQTSVLIVGAGPVGLGLAIELGHRGVPCLVVERNDRVGYAPRAKTTNIRTREHLRRWGIADKLRDASPLGIDYPANIVFATRLGGHLITRIHNAQQCAPGRNPFYSEHGQWIPQYAVEEVLRAHAESLPGVEIRFSCEMLGFEQDAERVTARVRDVETGREKTLTGRYLVGADGSRSQVRAAIGAKMEGKSGLSRNYNIVFRSPGLAQKHRMGPAIMYWQVNGEVPSVMGPMDSDDRWYFGPTQLPDGVKIPAEDVPALICRATRLDIPVEVLSADEWTANRLLADKYRDRRVFLAGDACHLHPPFGGYGMNMGVCDAVDLGWKIAAVLQGWGGPKLLDSYEIERRPAHEMVLDEAVVNHSVLGNQLFVEGLEDDGPAGTALRAQVAQRIQLAKTREFSNLGVVLGYRYEGSPITIDDGTVAPERDCINYIPSAHPGCLAPHAWLHDGTSLYDHFGWGYTLLDLGKDEAPAEVERVRSAAQDRGVPLKVLRPGAGFVRDLYQARFALVRPDQHVGWRGHAIPDRAESLFATLCGD